MSAPLLAMRGVAKAFGASRALDGVSLELNAGEVLAFDRSDLPPLLFHGGRYAVALQRTSLPGGAQRRCSSTRACVARGGAW